ncbi:hypothetical protein JCM14036_22800 [Desulfotomaculum defluvii]
MALSKLKELIDWDYDFKNEFQNRVKKVTFVIDAWESPKLAIYKVTPFGINCNHLGEQPPLEMLEAAIKEQEVTKEKMYKINQELKVWIENNILND